MDREMSMLLLAKKDSIRYDKAYTKGAEHRAKTVEKVAPLAVGA